VATSGESKLIKHFT